MIFEDYNAIILVASLMIGYLFWIRFPQINNNKTFGDWMIERKIIKWKKSKKSRLTYDEENLQNKQFKFFGASHDGSLFSLELTTNDQYHEAYFVLKLNDGSIISSREYQPISADDNVKTSGYAIGNLWIEILMPYTKWRITFNGSLKVQEPGSQNDTERHIVFTLFWNAASDPVEWPLNWNEQLLVSQYFVGDRSSHDIPLSLSELSEVNSGFDQFGSFFGQITIENDNGKNAIEFNLPGVRIVRDIQKQTQQAHDDICSMVGVCRDGVVYTLHGKKAANHRNIVYSGVVRTPDLHVRCIEGTKSDLLDIDGAQFPILSKLKTNKKEFELRINKSIESKPIFTKHGIQRCFSLDINGQSGIGVVLTKVKRTPDAQIYANKTIGISENAKINPNLLTVFFNEPSACNEQLSGGKGASLAYLTQLQKQSDKANDFIVPNGFILTSNAFKWHLKQNKILHDAIVNIENIVYRRARGSLDEACMKLDKLFNQVRITQEIADAVAISFHVLEKHSVTELKLAVRSSAIGEDSSELSSAGQNESFLGLSYLDEVLKSIQMCWASLYSVQSVKYRAQNAKPIVTEMATVVQEMVAADCAGVLFTRHPVTNNPNNMLVTANYGLGESVVSGLVDPDVFIVHHSNANNNFSILERKLGGKSQFVHMTPEDITSTSDVPIGMQKKLCVSDVDLVKLCEIGILLQESYGSPRDIEWAIYKEKIYLLQSRPMTSMNAFTSWELLHEFDTVVMSEDDLHTFGNVGEVMPQAATPLSISVLGPSFEKGLIQNFPVKIDAKCFHQVMAFSHNRLAMQVFNVFFQLVKKDITMENKVHGLTVFGHEFITEKIHQIALHRYGAASKWVELYSMWNVFKNGWKGKSTLEKLNCFMEEFIGTYDDKNSKWSMSTKSFYDDIDTKIGDSFVYVNSVHGSITMLSVVYQIITFSILSEKRNDFSREFLNDITTILTACKNSESAEIPVLLETITSAIAECGTATAEEFCSIPPSEGVQWLDANCSVAFKLFEIFIEKNKHRGFQEFDLGYETWGMNPSLVIEMLQTSVRNQRQMGKREKVDSKRTNEEIIESLKTITKTGTKRALRFFLPRCQDYVQHRERTKSLLIAYIHELRKAYIILAEKMQKDGCLPETNLIFYLTHREIGQVLNQNHMRSYLISKAMRRRRFYSEWKKLEFDEFNWGMIKPKTRNNAVSADKSKIVQGTPVHEGTVTGRACVVKTFAEVSKIKAGDILIAHSTDIAWSPYFPILSGVVTELGGLISHGAVVAREYGLPAIVGASNATSIIPDGEEVIMDAAAGTVTLKI